MFRLLLKLRELYQNHWWLAPLTMIIFWRVGLEIIGRSTLAFTTPVLNPWPADPNPPLWARWDSGWYSAILSYGYQLRAGMMSNVTFFPLYPLLWKIVWLVSGLPRLAAGVLTANLLTIAGTIATYRWAQVTYGNTTAQRTLAWLLIFPTSFFLAAAYSESTLVLLVALTLLAAERRQWLLAALVAALASAARPVGIALWPALITMWWQATKSPRPWRSGIAVLLLPPVGLTAFSAYLWYATGDSLAWLHGQAMAARGYVFPLRLLAAYMRNVATLGELWLTHLGELAALGFAAALLPRLWRQNRGHAVLVLGLLAPPLFTNTLTSFPRFTLVALPLFATLAQTKQRWLTWTYAAISLPLLAFGVYCFVTWWWAG
jgi:hypothetical protein